MRLICSFLLLTITFVALSCSAQTVRAFDSEIDQTITRLTRLKTKLHDPYKLRACDEGIDTLMHYRNTDFGIPLTSGSITFLGSKHVAPGLDINKVIACKETLLAHFDTAHYDCIFAEGFTLEQGVRPSINAIAKRNLAISNKRWASAYPGTQDTMTVQQCEAGLRKDLPESIYWVWDHLETHPDARIYGVDNRTLRYCFIIARSMGDTELIDSLKHAKFYGTLQQAYYRALNGEHVAIAWGPGHESDCRDLTQRTGIPINIVIFPQCSMGN